MTHDRDRIEHTMAFGTPVVEHWLEQEIIFTLNASLSDTVSISSATQKLTVPTAFMQYSCRSSSITGQGLSLWGYSSSWTLVLGSGRYEAPTVFTGNEINNHSIICFSGFYSLRYICRNMCWWMKERNQVV